MMQATEDFKTILKGYEKFDADRIEKAYSYAERIHEGEKRVSGEPLLKHLVATAHILYGMNLDADSIIAGLLHHALEADTLIKGITAGSKAVGKSSREELEKEHNLLEQKRKAEILELFGKETALIVDGVSRIAMVKAKNKTIQQAETIRKMLFAMTEDIRVILVKLADKLDNMRTIKFLEELDQKRIASECIEIYAPLAERLGISSLKDELEDLSLKSLNRDAFDQIKSIVAGKKVEREAFLKRVEDAIQEETKKSGYSVTIESRAKHFYSIYQKMRKRSKTIDELYDLLGIRVFCEERDDCYALLGVVHSLWKPMDGRFKDYIAFPKANGYRSLHTTVMCYDGRLLEIQIRTHEMHEVAEFGIASHWLYKKGSTNEIVRPDDLAIINRLKSWKDISFGSGEFLKEIKSELLKDSIFVFTPKGDAIELPSGSTALDFAYMVHSEVGNHCVGAKSSGSIIPLGAELHNTQVIEILTQTNAHPNINWLRQVKTAKARSKIRQWLIQNDLALAIDMNIVAKKKEDSPESDEKVRREQRSKEVSPDEPVKTVVQRNYNANFDSGKLGIIIDGERDLMIKIAGCCKPTSGDPIIGYVSRGRGIIVHKANCHNLQAITDYHERGIEVEWETESPRIIKRFRVVSRRSLDLFSEIEGAVRKFHGHLIEGRLEDSDGNRLQGTFLMELDTREDVKKAVQHIRSIPSIISIQSID